jgi:hypothetical protein
LKEKHSQSEEASKQASKQSRRKDYSCTKVIQTTHEMEELFPFHPSRSLEHHRQRKIVIEMFICESSSGNIVKLRLFLSRWCVRTSEILINSENLIKVRIKFFALLSRSLSV